MNEVLKRIMELAKERNVDVLIYSPAGGEAASVKFTRGDLTISRIISNTEINVYPADAVDLIIKDMIETLDTAERAIQLEELRKEILND